MTDDVLRRNSWLIAARDAIIVDLYSFRMTIKKGKEELFCFMTLMTSKVR
jgi:hypothetical protein